MNPFIIYALPRSRTAWLSEFLSYDGCQCYHERSITFRSLQDIQNLLSQPETGMAETGAIQARLLIKYLFPDIKEIVILRPADEAMIAMKKAAAGIVSLDEDKLHKIIKYSDRELRKLSKNVFTLNHEDLDKEWACKEIFEYCLDRPFDKEWWWYLKNINIQADMKAFFSYYMENRMQIEDFKKQLKCDLRALYRAGEITHEMRA